MVSSAEVWPGFERCTRHEVFIEIPERAAAIYSLIGTTLFRSKSCVFHTELDSDFAASWTVAA